MGETRNGSYTSTFTDRIPVSYGLWKFHGLPGLILAINDVDGLITWNATKIIYPFSSDIDLKEMHSGDNYRRITLRAYLEERSQRRKEEDKNMMSKLPKGTKIVESST